MQPLSSEDTQISNAILHAGAATRSLRMLKTCGAIDVTMTRRRWLARGTAFVAGQGCHFNCTSLFEAV